MTSGRGLGVFLTADILSDFGRTVGGEACELWFDCEVMGAGQGRRSLVSTAKRFGGGSAGKDLSLDLGSPGSAGSRP